MDIGEMEKWKNTRSSNGLADLMLATRRGRLVQLVACDTRHR